MPKQAKAATHKPFFSSLPNRPSNNRLVLWQRARRQDKHHCSDSSNSRKPRLWVVSSGHRPFRSRQPLTRSNPCSVHHKHNQPNQVYSSSHQLSQAKAVYLAATRQHQLVGSSVLNKPNLQPKGVYLANSPKPLQVSLGPSKSPRLMFLERRSLSLLSPSSPMQVVAFSPNNCNVLPNSNGVSHSSSPKPHYLLL